MQEGKKVNKRGLSYQPDPLNGAIGDSKAMNPSLISDSQLAVKITAAKTEHTSILSLWIGCL